MTRRRWIADDSTGTQAFLRGQHARHLAEVLRVRPGQEFEVSVGGEVRQAVVRSVAPELVEFELGDYIPSTRLLAVSLYLAIFKFDRMEWAIEKCTELGVAEIIPLIAQRTDNRLAAAAVKRVERWRRIANEASEQSRSPLPPAIANPVDLKSMLQSPATRSGNRIILSEIESDTRLRDLSAQTHEGVSLAVGPEGGWTEGEITAFASAGWKSASLGPRILRVETAAIAAVSIVTASI